ncbi:MAG: DNA polymerase-3 subunit delta' [Myxococcota bacterium]|jgi:DNA polymerase-3 subunit delta'
MSGRCRGAGRYAVGMSEILGNEDVRERLLRLADRDELHHCLLFEGPAGLGKAAAARWLASAVNCEAMLGGRPCGQCWSCKSIESDQHPDIIQVGFDPERTAPIISVRQARELLTKLTLRPYRAKQRFVIIDPADMMRAETANALLKTFEEPPRDTGFILVCESALRLLPTVRSRSQRVRFRPVDAGALTRWLEEKGVEDAAWLARLSDGCPGRALELSQGEAAVWREQRDALLDALRGSATERFGYAEKLTQARKGRGEWTPRVITTLDALERLSRDALRCHAGVSEETWYNTDCPEVVAEWARRLQVAGCLRVADAVDKARKDMAAFVNGRLLVDALLARVSAELG